MSKKKPSALATLILLFILLLPLLGIGALGWWGYNRFFAKPDEPKGGGGAVVAEVDPAKSEEKVATENKTEPPEPAKAETPEEAPSGSGEAARPPATLAASNPFPEAAPAPMPADPGLLAGMPNVPGAGSATPSDPVTPPGSDAGGATPVKVPAIGSMPPVVPEGGSQNSQKPETTSGAGQAAGGEEAMEVAVVDVSKPEVPDTPPALPVERPTSVEEEFTKFSTDSPEGKALVSDALARINEAPADLYSDREKRMVKAGIESATQLAKVCTVFFGTGKNALPEAELSRLDQAVSADDASQLAANPKAVFFVLGFADPSGSADFNKKLSMQRAQVVVDLLQGDFQIPNMVYPVAIGPTEIVSDVNKEKNRAAEVWIVQP